MLPREPRFDAWRKVLKAETAAGVGSAIRGRVATSRSSTAQTGAGSCREMREGASLHAYEGALFRRIEQCMEASTRARLFLTVQAIAATRLSREFSLDARADAARPEFGYTERQT